MKPKTKSKIIVISALGVFFALSPIITVNLSFNAGNNNKSSDYNDDINLDNENLKLSKISERIHINNNWTDAKVAGICTGDGTYSVPYVIEDLVIDGEYSGNCIWIENSNVYFKIENCTVTNSEFSNAGIELSNANNGYLTNNNCSNNYRGIYLDHSNNNIISGNFVKNNNRSGIDLYDSDHNNISGNTANNHSHGIYLYDSDYNNISGNTLNDNFMGIRISDSGDNDISGNNANYNYYGISLLRCNNNALLGNTAINNQIGITLTLCNYITISGNTANSNDWEGIGLSSCTYNTISGNAANYNYQGIYLGASNNNNISGNTANNNYWGIYLSSSDYNTISGNILIGNDICIKEAYCEGNIFENNDCGTIPGYNLFFLLGILSVVAIILSKKMKKTILLKTKNSKLF